MTVAHLVEETTLERQLAYHEFGLYDHLLLGIEQKTGSPLRPIKNTRNLAHPIA